MKPRGSFRHWAHILAPSSAISITRSLFYWEIIHENTSWPTNLFPAFLQLCGQLRAWRSRKEWCTVVGYLLPDRDRLAQRSKLQSAVVFLHTTPPLPLCQWTLKQPEVGKGEENHRGEHLLSTVVYRADSSGRSRLMGVRIGWDPVWGWILL